MARRRKRDHRGHGDDEAVRGDAMEASGWERGGRRALHGGDHWTDEEGSAGAPCHGSPRKVYYDEWT